MDKCPAVPGMKEGGRSCRPDLCGLQICVWFPRWRFFFALFYRESSIRLDLGRSMWPLLLISATPTCWTLSSVFTGRRISALARQEKGSGHGNLLLCKSMRHAASADFWDYSRNVRTRPKLKVWVRLAPCHPVCQRLSSKMWPTRHRMRDLIVSIE